MKKKSKKNIALRVAVDGILGALALALAFLESLIPDIAFMPPGAKLGLANVAVMFAVLTIGIPDGFFIVIIKSGFVFLTRGAAAFFMSFSGGLLSCLALITAVIVSKKIKKDFSYIGVSIVCAVMHNIGQLAAASVYTDTNLVFSYLPLLLVFGVISGGVTGIVLRTVMPALVKSKLLNNFYNST